MLATRLAGVLFLCALLTAFDLGPGDLVPLGPRDRSLLEAAGRELQLERAVARVARERRVRPLARTVAAETIARVTSLLDSAVALAARKGLKLPHSVAREDRNLVRLTRIVWTHELEREVAHLLGESARRLADRCGTGAREAEDADVRAWAGKAEPVLREIEAFARELGALERQE